MAEPQCHGMSETRRKGTSKHATMLVEADEPVVAAPAPVPAAPCGACKFLRRKCISGCIFAPHFGSDQGAARFAAVHKVFGASNVSKLLLHIPVNRRHDAVVTISYEAQARLSDPVYGCVSTILSLQQQVNLHMHYHSNQFLPLCWFFQWKPIKSLEFKQKYQGKKTGEDDCFQEKVCKMMLAKLFSCYTYIFF